MLTREQILALNDRRTKAVAVPEWDTTVYVRQFSGRERHEFERIVFAAGASEPDTMAALTALCACDESGNRLFTDDDVEALQDKNASALATIAKAAVAFNVISDEAIETAGNG